MRAAAPTINMKGKIGFELGGTRSTFSKSAPENFFGF